jgi:hypothetical protein
MKRMSLSIEEEKKKRKKIGKTAGDDGGLRGWIGDLLVSCS